jgi:hypothetical protein
VDREFRREVKGQRIRQIVHHLQAYIERTYDYVRRVESAPPLNPYYVALLVRHGDHPFAARVLAHMIVTLGAEYADKVNRKRRVIVKGIRVFGKKRTRRVSFIAKTSRKMLSMPIAHSLINDIFAESDHLDLAYEFANLLERASKADPAACRRAADIAKAVAGDVPPPRGRKVGVATTTHELLVQRLHIAGKVLAHTWSDEQGDFVDPLPQATRDEIGDPDFNPRSALRRMAARLQREAKRRR